MPKFDSSMEQESLSTESQIDAEKMSDEFPNNGRHDAEITECDPSLLQNIPAEQSRPNIRLC